jgi:acyl carrier protein
MADEIRSFIVSSLKDMNYDVDGVDDATTLGPAGLDLESLALADLLMRVEDEYHIRFAEDESEELALMNLGEFTGAVTERVSQATSSQQV